MKKRILSILLALCMLFCLVPTTAFAAGETNRKVETEQELVDALADSSVDIITLKNDIAIGTTLTVLRKVTLDLNGYVLKMTGSGSVIILDNKSGITGDLTLIDSNPTAEHKFKVNGVEPWVLDDSGTETVYGGIITGGTGSRIFFTNGVEGGGVIIGSGALTMNGGNIVGCIANRGGGLFLSDGSFTMNAGSIVGCSTPNRLTTGEAFHGGIYAFGPMANRDTTGVITLTGGLIKNNGRYAINAAYMTTIYANGGEVYGEVHLNQSSKITCLAEDNGITAFKGKTVIGGTSSVNPSHVDWGLFYGGLYIYGNTTGVIVTYKDGDSEYAKQVLPSGTLATRPDAPAATPGYTFGGWNKADGTAWDYASDKVTDNITLYAKWAANTYTITFDTAGGSEIAPITQDYGTVITAPEAPTREGYTFIGWDKAIPETMPAENITLKARWKDTEKPTGEIIIGTNKWQEFLNKLTFGLFFKDTQTVTINAADNSGTVFVSYLVTDRDLSEEELKSLVFSGYEEPFRIEPNGEYIVYVMLVDESLNITYLRSDRITLDNVLPVISGIEDGKTYCEAQTVTITEKYIDTVTVNGTAVTLDENGSFVLSPTNGKQKIVVTDKAGNTAEMTVTVNDGHTLLADDNDCTTPVYCKFCNAEVIAAKSHRFTGNWQNDETAHWHICQNENCTVTDRKTAHSGEDDGNCLTAVVCECGYVITAAKPAHMFNEWTSNGNGTHNRKCTGVGCNCIETENCFGGKATCTEQAVCTVCHTGYGDVLGHNFTIAQHDETHHWNKCSRCDATDTKANHTGGTATCREKAVCEVCHSAYGKLSAANHVGGTEIRNIKDKTCTENGYTGDTYCKGCGEKLSSGTVIHADGHKGGTATCTDKAECEVCHEKYGEPDANHHTGLETVDAVPATAASTGTAAHWRCTACGKLFADADGKQEIRSEDTVTKKLAPSILDGANSEWRKGDENGLTFSSDAAFSDFVEVLVDGKPVASENYERQGGGIIVELKASFLETLAEGEHTLTIRSASGDATTRFTIAASDSTNAWVWIIMGFIALGIGVTVAVFVVRKRKTA